MVRMSAFIVLIFASIAASFPSYGTKNTLASHGDNDTAQELLNSNVKWAADVSRVDPNFFPDSAKYPQKPHVRSLSLSSYFS
jgi:hypothetical protein